MGFCLLSRSVSDDTTGGTYTLVLALDTETNIEVGALGSRRFAPGGYAYVGSARGAGGFARIERHREVAAGERDTRHWHIDYLLGHPDTGIESVRKTAGVDGECAVAGALRNETEPVPDFGCSDCDCEAHLCFAPESAALRVAVERAHDRLTSDS